ncbi:MAG: chromosomal replication initiator protein DnaA [Treponema sp.]|nr:chromosomal replication initiator protein DnaA [Treponema sp.]
MSEHNYREIWQEAINQIHEDFKSKGQEDEFNLWFKMEYVEDTFTTITVAVASKFMWDLMVSRGYVDIVAKKICEITGLDNIKIQSQQSESQPSKTTSIPNAATTPNGNLNQNSQIANQNSSSESAVVEKQISEERNNLQNYDIPKAQTIVQLGNYEKDFPSDSNDFNLGIEKESDTEKEADSQINDKNVNIITTTSHPFKKHPQLREDYTFEKFVPGDNSSLAYKVCLEAAKNPGGEKLNPILIYGGVGLGKTHLMQSIGNYIYQQQGDEAKICCVSAEKFTNEFIASLNEKATSKFKNKYRGLDVLLIDDIHFLQDKEGTQEELFHTFNALYDNNAQLVFTCDRPISELKNITDRLKSRFSLGINVDIQMPNYETRRAILIQKQKSLSLNKKIPDEVIDFVAKNVQTNVRDLEASLKKLVAYADLLGTELTIEIAQQQLRDLFSSPQSGTITIDVIQKVVADHYNISLSDIKGKKRDRKVVIPRQIALYIARQLTEYSWHDLGNEFGGRDHTTAMHSYEKIESAIQTDSNLNSLIALLIRNIKDYKSHKI